MQDQSKLFISRTFPPKSILYEGDTRSLLLRPFETDDLLAVHDALDISYPALNRFMMWPEKKWDLERCLQWVVERHTEYYSGSVFEWGVFDRSSGTLLGAVGIMPCTPFNPDSYEVGYWTDVRHAGNGIATLSTQIAVAVGFECLKILRMQVSTMSENLASVKVIEKCGFSKEGVLRGFYPPPTDDWAKQWGASAHSDLLCALLPDDRQRLPWYASLLEKTSVTPLHGEPIQLQKIGSWDGCKVAC